MFACSKGHVDRAVVQSGVFLNVVLFLRPMAKHQAMLTKFLYHGESEGNGADVERDREFGTTQMVLSRESGSSGPSLEDAADSTVVMQQTPVLISTPVAPATRLRDGLASARGVVAAPALQPLSALEKGKSVIPDAMKGDEAS